jgi:hypothetical protein
MLLNSGNRGSLNRSFFLEEVERVISTAAILM